MMKKKNINKRGLPLIRKEGKYLLFEQIDDEIKINGITYECDKWLVRNNVLFLDDKRRYFIEGINPLNIKPSPFGTNLKYEYRYEGEARHGVTLYYVKLTQYEQDLKD